MGQQKHVYLVKDINVLEVNILSVLMCFTFHMKITKGRQKPGKQMERKHKWPVFFSLIFIKGQIYTQV